MPLLVSYIGVYWVSGCQGVWGGGSRPVVLCNQFPQKGRYGCYLIGSRYILNVLVGDEIHPDPVMLTASIGA